MSRRVDHVTFDWLTVFTWPRYASMTLAPYRAFVDDPAASMAPSAQRLAIGAAVGGRPIGLALASVDADGTGECLSIYVQRDERRRGVGTELLARLEDGLAAAGCPTIALRYDASAAAARDVERLLARRGWPAARRCLRFLMLDGAISAAPWFAAAVLPPPYRIEPWSTVTARERHALHASPHFDAWIPDELMPGSFETGLDPDISLALRYDGSVIGWALLRPIDDRTVHYANVFVRRSHNRAGRTYAALAIIAEAVRNQIRARGVRSRGLFEIAPENMGFLRFVDRHLRPFLLLDQELSRVTKTLTAAPFRR